MKAKIVIFLAHVLHLTPVFLRRAGGPAFPQRSLNVPLECEVWTLSRRQNIYLLIQLQKNALKGADIFNEILSQMNRVRCGRIKRCKPRHSLAPVCVCVLVYVSFGRDFHGCLCN